MRGVVTQSRLLCWARSLVCQGRRRRQSSSSPKRSTSIDRPIASWTAIRTITGRRIRKSYRITLSSIWAVVTRVTISTIESSLGDRRSSNRVVAVARRSRWWLALINCRSRQPSRFLRGRGHYIRRMVSWLNWFSINHFLFVSIQPHSVVSIRGGETAKRISSVELESQSWTRAITLARDQEEVDTWTRSAVMRSLGPAIARNWAIQCWSRPTCSQR